MFSKINTESTDNRAEAKKIADGMYKENCSQDIERDLRSLMERLGHLTDNSLQVDFDPFLDCRGILIEMVCLLSNPVISSKIQEDYYKENAGRILKKIILFFDSLMDDEHAQKYLTWYNLKHFCAHATKEDLQDIELKYLK